ncbi:AzlD family protein [Halolamina sediminis]|uniref:AzlD family protein n=1 Tax=Halolamina sediminis TaxID=1480675 RepID=UPI001929DC29|nr:AzlD domain-containing protein [Halolamina sediminis]
MSAVDPTVVAVVAAMAVLTYLTKAGGFWLLGHVDTSERVDAALSVLPGAVVVSIVAPELLNGGPSAWLGAAAVVLLTRKTGSLLAALVGGMGVLLAVRAVL